MTHNEIYTKFMIEYDKANVTSSYPSLTEYEVATVLDKAYNALIAQKVSGNNYRRIPFEADVKVISDLQPLVVKHEYSFEHHLLTDVENNDVPNMIGFENPEDFLYTVGCYLRGDIAEREDSEEVQINTAEEGARAYIGNSTDFLSSFYELKDTYLYNKKGGWFEIKSGEASSNLPNAWKIAEIHTDENGNMILTNMSNVFTTLIAVYDYFQKSNHYWFAIIPWVRNSNNAAKIDQTHRFIWHTKTTILSNGPQDARITRSLPCQLVDFKTAERFFASAYNIPWIKNPVYFIHDNNFFVVYDILGKYTPKQCILKYIKKPATFVKTLPERPTEDISFFTGAGGQVVFELNDTMAEELISLAIAYALENIESPRLNSKLNMRGLEA